MTDRELLERAAKAAGIAANSWSDVHKCLFIARGPYPNTYEKWNPLEDDGDALRLAVKLKINIEHMETLSRKQYGVNCWPVGRGDCQWIETDMRDPYAATRRAIVRAAAAMSEGV